MKYDENINACVKSFTIEISLWFFYPDCNASLSPGGSAYHDSLWCGVPTLMNGYSWSQLVEAYHMESVFPCPEFKIFRLAHI